MKLKSKIKFTLGIIALTGILLQGIELYFKPDLLIIGSSKSYPEYLLWVRWLVTLGAATGYFFLENKSE